MGILPIFLYSFSKRYTGSAQGANVSVIGLNAIGTTGGPHPFAQLSFFEASISPRADSTIESLPPAPLLPCGFEQADGPADRAAAKRAFSSAHRRGPAQRAPKLANS